MTIRWKLPNDVLEDYLFDLDGARSREGCKFVTLRSSGAKTQRIGVPAADLLSFLELNE